MAHGVRMPNLGQTTEEMVLVAWHKAEGDTVARGEVLLEVETDKATLEVEATAEGTVLRLLFGPGDIVEHGQIIAWLGEPGEQPPEDATDEAQAAAAAREPEGEAQAAAAARAPEPRATGGAAKPPPGKVLAAAAVRKLAQEHGIDVTTIAGSGPEGRIERSDVLAEVERRHEPKPSADGDVAVPPHRRIVAQRLTRSVQTIPQFTVTVSVDMGPSQAWLAGQRSDATLTHLILRAMARALREVPQMNTRWIDEGPALRSLPGAGVGLAVAAEDRLLVISIPDPDELDIDRLVELMGAAVTRARKGMIQPADMAPVAITLSNLGMFGVDEFEAIVDPDQTAILATGSVQDRPAVSDGTIAVVPQMTMSLTSDHRVVDGVVAARYLTAVRRNLAEPS